MKSSARNTFRHFQKRFSIGASDEETIMGLAQGDGASGDLAAVGHWFVAESEGDDRALGRGVRSDVHRTQLAGQS